MSAERPLSYWITLARLGFEEDLARLMSKKEILKSDLAKNAEVSPPFITKALSGTNNYTLKTMAKLARAVGAVLEIRLADEQGEVVRVLDYETARKLDTVFIPPPAQVSARTTTNVVSLQEFRDQRPRPAELGASTRSMKSALLTNWLGEGHG